MQGGQYRISCPSLQRSLLVLQNFAIFRLRHAHMRKDTRLSTAFPYCKRRKAGRGLGTRLTRNLLVCILREFFLWLCEIWCTRTVAWIVPAGEGGVVIAMATKTWNLYIVDLTQVCSCLIILHYSLRNNGLTDIGAIVLARALEHNKSLEELKWVVDWVSCYQELWGLKNMYLYTLTVEVSPMHTSSYSTDS